MPKSSTGPVLHENQPFHVPHVPLHGLPHKSCSLCGRLKPANRQHFPLDLTAWDGLYPRCFDCSPGSKR